MTLVSVLSGVSSLTSGGLCSARDYRQGQQQSGCSAKAKPRGGGFMAGAASKVLMALGGRENASLPIRWKTNLEYEPANDVCSVN